MSMKVDARGYLYELLEQCLHRSCKIFVIAIMENNGRTVGDSVIEVT